MDLSAYARANDPLLTPSKAAKRLGVTSETIRRWMKKGALPYVEVGPNHRKRVYLSDVERQRVSIA